MAEGPRPGLLILDMSNDQLKGVVYNKPTVIANIAQLAMSDFFHVCIDSKAEVPAFRAKQPGAQIVDELAGFEHLNQLPKKEDSALSNPKVLETFKGIGVTHVCICGISTDTSIHATAKDLIDNGFEIFVVKDATTSKNGKFGHDKGLRKIQSDFGDNVVVGVDDLLGEEESGGGGGAPKQAPAPAAATSRGKPAYLADGPVQRPAVDEKAEKARLTDAEKLAARKKQVDEARFAHIKKANAEALANADPKRAAEIQKDSVEAEKFAQNLPQNKKAPNAAAPAPSPAAPAAAAAAAPVSSTNATSPPPPVAASPPASSSKATPTKSTEAPKQEQQEVGCLCGMFGGRKLEDGDDAPSSIPSSDTQAANPSASSPAPAPKAAAAAATSPAPAAATTKAAPAPSQPAPSNAGLKDAPTPAQPVSAPTAAPEEADPVAPSSTARGGAPMAIPPAPGAQPPSATAVPGGAAGQKTWIKPLPEGEKKTTYTPDGAVAQPLGVKKMVQGDDVQERIRGLQEGGIKTVPVGPRKMKTPKIVTDTKETWDREGNITREITRYITEIDGTKRTEKEIVKVPAKKKDSA